MFAIPSHFSGKHGIVLHEMGSGASQFNGEQEDEPLDFKVGLKCCFWWFTHDLPMIYPWFCVGFGDLPWFIHDFVLVLVIYPWFIHDFMLLWWFTMNYQWFTMILCCFWGFTMIYPYIYLIFCRSTLRTLCCTNTCEEQGSGMKWHIPTW